MNGYTEFFMEDGRLLIHIEYYAGTARHFVDYALSETDAKKTAELLGSDNETDLIKRLTARFSIGNAVLEFLRENGINGKIVEQGFEDGVSDV